MPDSSAKLAQLNKTSVYEDIEKLLLRINTKTQDISGEIVFDQSNTSFSSNFRRLIEQLTKKQQTPKDEYLGVVIDVKEEYDTTSKRIINKIYVDVPGLNIENFPHPDKIGGNFNSNVLENKVFYPVSDNVFLSERPAPNDIVRVKVPDNYFNTFNVNAYDKKYLGLFYNSNGLLPAVFTGANTSNSTPPNPLSLQQNRAALTRNKPANVSNNDLVSLPFNGSYPITSMPAPRFWQGRVSDHKGIDFRMPENTPIIAPTDMVITVLNRNEESGLYLYGTNSRYLYFFCHLNGYTVTRNQKVTKGQQIAISGFTGRPNSGPHLHFAIRDLNDKSLNPLYFIKGDVNVSPDQKIKFGLNSDTITLPISEKVFESQPIAINTNETPKTPTANSTSKTQTNEAKSGSPPVNRPKLLIVDFSVDQSSGTKEIVKKGAKKIKIREDIFSDLLKIKEKLNQYNIPLTCNSFDISLNNKDITLLGKVGLELRLNKDSAISDGNDLFNDDYFVSPDFNFPLGNGFKLIIYGNVKRDIKYFNEIYKPEKKILDVYQVVNGKLVIKKIFKNVINITQIFEDFGFKQALPNQEFFIFNKIEKSNWNIFQKPNKINIGYSYKELLLTVYEKDNNPIWRLPDLKWDGNKFV